MKILLIHTTGNQYVRALLRSFNEAGMLAKFVTTIAVNKDSWWLKLLPKSTSQQLTRRVFPLPESRLSTRPWLEVCRNLFAKLGWQWALRHEIGFASIDKVHADLDKAVAAKLEKKVKQLGITAVYAFEDGALETFKKAKKLGLTCIYDLPIVYWETGRSLMQEEAERVPDWRATLAGGIIDSPEKLDRKTAELQLADVVVVSGQFLVDSLPAWAKAKRIIVAPFGSPKPLPSQAKKNTNGPLRVLFVGSMGQRKGLADLFAAARLLGPAKIELVALGHLMAPIEFYERQFDNFTYAPVRPHEQMLEFMQGCDVFCLPSIVEGRALVMQAAMSQGLPLLITPNTGGEDLIIEGETGFLVPVRSAQKLAERLDWFVAHRAEVLEMGKKAQLHAARYTWKAYGDTIIHELKNWHV